MRRLLYLQLLHTNAVLLRPVAAQSQQTHVEQRLHLNHATEESQYAISQKLHSVRSMLFSSGSLSVM